MKHTLPFLALFFFVFGCKKYEAEYAVNCQFGPFFYGKDKVVIVTNAGGEVLKTLPVPEGVNGLSELFTVDGKDLPEQYDLHFIYNQNFSSSSRTTRIFSHLDVPNGALVYFVTESGFPKYIRPATIRIQGVESFDSLDVVDSYSFNGQAQAIFSQNEKMVEYKPYVPVNQGLVLRLLANGESQFRHLYLPDSLIRDTISVAWQDFKPENNFRQIELPANQPAGILEISAVSQDLDSYVTLLQAGNTLHSSPVSFNHPQGLAEPIAYSIRAELDGASFEKMFQPGEPLRFEASNMTIDDISFSGTKLSVRTSGQIDFLRAQLNTFESGNLTGGVVFWQIDGKPESFGDHTLPVLSDYLPDWYNDAQTLKTGTITAGRFDNHDYPQIREGFPYRLKEPFAVARSGYQAVWKFFF